MSSRTRRHFSAPQKAEVVRRHVAGKEAVSDLADELKIQPSQIHLWVKQVLDQAERAFDRPGLRRSADDPKDRRISELQATVAQREATIAQREAKLAQKNEVISELMQEHVQLNKEPGRKIGQRWRPTRAPTQALEVKGASTHNTGAPFQPSLHFQPPGDKRTPPLQHASNRNSL